MYGTRGSVGTPVEFLEFLKCCAGKCRQCRQVGNTSKRDACVSTFIKTGVDISVDRSVDTAICCDFCTTDAHLFA